MRTSSLGWQSNKRIDRFTIKTKSEVGIETFGPAESAVAQTSATADEVRREIHF